MSRVTACETKQKCNYTVPQILIIIHFNCAILGRKPIEITTEIFPFENHRVLSFNGY